MADGVSQIKRFALLYIVDAITENCASNIVREVLLVSAQQQDDWIDVLKWFEASLDQLREQEQQRDAAPGGGSKSTSESSGRRQSKSLSGLNMQREERTLAKLKELIMP